MEHLEIGDERAIRKNILTQVENRQVGQRPQKIHTGQIFPLKIELIEIGETREKIPRGGRVKPKVQRYQPRRGSKSRRRGHQVSAKIERAQIGKHGQRGGVADEVLGQIQRG